MFQNYLQHRSASVRNGAKKSPRSLDASGFFYGAGNRTRTDDLWLYVRENYTFLFLYWILVFSYKRYAVVTRRLHRIQDWAGLPRIRFHDLRHTFATLTLEAGVDVKTVSQMLGHTDAGFTMNTYMHVTDDMQKNAADKMKAIIENADKSDNVIEFPA